MASIYMNIITPEKLLEAKQKGEDSIRIRLRIASTMRALAEKLDGTYVTKRLEAKLREIIPGAVYFCFRNYCDSIELCIGYPREGYTNEYDDIRICDKKTRRINGELLKKNAENCENEAKTRQIMLDNLEAAVAAYNNLADRYAQIYTVLDEFMYDDIPIPGWNIKKQYEKIPPEIIADLFADPESSAAESLPDPIPLPVNSAQRFTMDEFIAAVTP